MSGRAAASGGDDIDLVSLWRTIWRGKFVVLAFIVAAATAAVLYLNTVTYFYTAQLKVVPASNEGGASSGSKLSGLAAMAGLGGGDTSELPFVLYKQGLQSRDVAEALSRDAQLMHHVFAAEWDEARQRWAKPTSTRSEWSATVKRTLGLPVYPWTAPDAARLHEFLLNRVSISENPASPVVTIMFDDPDPQFAARFLRELNEAVNQSIRQKTLRKTGDHIEYLSRKLMTATLVEHRASLAAELSEQERQRMMASSSAPFAAEPIDRVVVSRVPTSPRPVLVLGAALLAGLLLGIVVVIIWGRLQRVSDGGFVEDAPAHRFG